MSEFFLNSFNTLGHGLIGYIIPFLFVLTIVVFFHELGHFLVARWAGVKVLTFSLGFGPELVGFNDRHGTRWKISAIPLGGYVKFFGDESEASTPASAETLAGMTDEERAGSFHHKKVGARAAIVAAGPIANFILAIVIFTCLFTFFGKPSTTARVDKIEASSAAERAGFQVGDVVTAIDGKKIGSFSDMQRFVSVRAGDTLTFTVKRGDSTLQLKGTPELREVKDPLRKHAAARAFSASPAQPRRAKSTTEKVDPATRALAGSQGNLVRHRPDAVLYRQHLHRPGERRPDRRADSDRADFGAGRHARTDSAASSGGGAVDLDRTAEPVPGSPARWRSPFVLCGRGAAGTSAVGEVAGIRVPRGAGSGADVDGVCYLQRLPSGAVAEGAVRKIVEAAFL